jgi:hypothetical protein
MDDMLDLPPVQAPAKLPEAPPLQTQNKPDKPPTLRAGGQLTAIIPQSFEEVQRIAHTMTISQMLPKSIEGTQQEKIGKASIIIMRGLEMGFMPVEAFSAIYLVNNKPTIYGDAILSLIQGSGQLKYFKEWREGTPKTDDWTACCEVERAGYDRQLFKFSWETAKTANLTGKSGPWALYPERMLQMRARAFAVRDTFADVLRGMRIAEEERDVEPDKEPTEPVNLNILDDKPIIEHETL